MSNLIPVSRKEQYLSKIDGMTNKSPDKTYTKEEYFFSEILGEALHKPVLETRYEMYLAKIAGREIGIPYPETRLEYFLAKACGMDIETPTPITREEILWSNYSAIVDFEVEGVPPLTYKAIEGTLENYRIYGDTVDGESVGDRTANLFDKSGSQYGNNLHWVPASGLVYSDTHYGSPIMDVTGLNTITRSYTGTSANYFLTSDLSQFVNASNIGTVDAGVTVNVPDGYTKYVFNIPNTIRPDSIMVNSGSTPLPYEPHGYKVPVTVSNGTDTLTTPIYLPEQIRKVGSEAEYIDYGEQKMYRIGADDLDVTLPALPTLTGTNTLSVGTEVQPSKVYVKYKGERQ